MSNDNKPWSKFTISKENRTELKYVHHATHIGSAIGILKDGIIKPSLITLSTALQNLGIHSLWLSPNHWSEGSRYGSILFHFEFRQLINIGTLYWVESMDDFKTPTVRFLISRKKSAKRYGLRKYDAALESGPIELVDGRYFWNSDLSLQIMIDESLDTNGAKKISTHKHHYDLCCISNDCQERNLQSYKIARVLVSKLLEKTYSLPTHIFNTKSTENGNEIKSGNHTLCEAVSSTLALAYRSTYKTDTKPVSKSRQRTIFKNAIKHLSANDADLFKHTVSSLNSYDQFESLYLDMIKTRFDLTEVESFL